MIFTSVPQKTAEIKNICFFTNWKRKENKTKENFLQWARDKAIQKGGNLNTKEEKRWIFNLTGYSK